jgi:asparagine synthase (glutamine-hydrolysing)
MCGIVGFFDTRAGSTPDRALLARMNGVQSHRGPDGDGEFFGDGVALGHRRLAIIDLASGQQPLFNEDGSVAIVYNGEIYNYAGLIDELKAKGHVFKTRCDTEVIVHAWEEWGEKCVERFNGMFAFALWDDNRKTLFLGRDRLGKKPLYYSLLDDGRLLFSSELKSILVEPKLKRELDPQAIEEYFAYGYVPDPRTILKSVKKLPPASTLVWKRGEGDPRPRTYWDVAFKPLAPASQEEIQAELIARLREATKIRLMSEVPLGAFLSGGVDSSAIVSQMAALSDSPVNTCSISFGDPRFNESEYAQKVATQFNTNHRTEQVDADDFDLLDELGGVYDEPFADSSAMPTYRVCQLARKHVTVALSGDGGDEVFAGYRRYRWHMKEERVRSLLPAGLRRPVFGLLGAAYPKIDWAPKFLRAKTTFEALARDSLEGYFHGVSIMPDRLRFPAYSQKFRGDLGGYHAVSVLRDHASRAPTQDPLSLIQYLDLKTYLPGDILVKVDRAAMAHSLEVRVPILDYTFVDWASGIPSGLKLKGDEGKWIFKKSLEKTLPDDILYRSKMGFGVPIVHWFRGPLRERVRQAVLGERLRDSGVFDMKFLERIVDEHQSGARDHSAALWALLMFDSSLKRLWAA